MPIPLKQHVARLVFVARRIEWQMFMAEVFIVASDEFEGSELLDPLVLRCSASNILFSSRPGQRDCSLSVFKTKYTLLPENISNIINNEVCRL